MLTAPFKLDHRVDQTYKNKHFPPSSFAPKPSNPNPSNAAPTVPNLAHHSLEGTPATTSSTLADLVSSFANLSIPAAKPVIEGDRPPPSPISTIPSEVLHEILLAVGILDPATFVRLAQVCKALAHLILSNETYRTWRRICLGPEFGFNSQHYKFACTVSGELPHYLDTNPMLSDSLPIIPSPYTTTLLNTHYTSWANMFHLRPRIRFHGVYISTVNYARPGGASPTAVSWNSAPILIVTYYRYLRFYRDGSLLSLLTTSEPGEVVHNLHKPEPGAHFTGAVKDTLRGRWRLSGPEASQKAPVPPNSVAHASELEPSSRQADPSQLPNHSEQEPQAAQQEGPEGEEEEEEEEGELHIETEGVAPKYMYVGHLSLRHASSGRHNSSNGGGKTRNNKLTWRGYWSYNKLTDDWAEFGLRNDRAFFWSRVRSYGNGG